VSTRREGNLCTKNLRYWSLTQRCLLLLLVADPVIVQVAVQGFISVLAEVACKVKKLMHLKSRGRCNSEAVIVASALMT